MRISRNKCELLAEYCLTGVKPVYKNGRAYVKGIDITDIRCIYSYISYRYACLKSNKKLMQLKYLENATQMFYLALNENLVIENNMTVELADRTEQEIKQISKYRELEEEIPYV